MTELERILVGQGTHKTGFGEPGGEEGEREGIFAKRLSEKHTRNIREVFQNPQGLLGPHAHGRPYGAAREAAGWPSAGTV